ncbi:MAG TPA: DUF4097 family beta strand repeat-containing protein [Blastocatellia bacterium]|nr:DUF4097 family beta strand repeat-containing protein [Blastocatellia bacterium]
MNRVLFRLLASTAFTLTLVAAAAAQDFQKSYNLGEGGRIRIGSVSGDVTVTGYEGNAIVVTAYKTGRDRDMVDIEDRSGGNRVDVRTRYPENCNCDASVRFEVQVPRSIRYDFEGISSVSGSVKVSSVRGRLHASSVSGSVTVRDVSGTVKASAVSGDVDVEISQLEGTDDMKFSSVSGNVDVRLPSSLDAEIEMSSLSGSLTTDFPIEIRRKEYGPGTSARGRVGDGTRQLKMSSVSGSINLKHL